jgi:hypothetical protein
LQILPHSNVGFGERWKWSGSPPNWLQKVLTKASCWVVVSEIYIKDKEISSEFNHETRFPGSRRLNKGYAVRVQMLVIDDLINCLPESGSVTLIGTRKGIEDG